MNNDTDRQNLNSAILVAIGLALLILLTFVILFSINKNSNRRIDELKSNVVIKKRNPFDKIEIEAQAAIVWDIKNNRAIFERKSTKELPLASLTKLVTIAVALESAPDYTTIPINNYALAAEGDTGLISGEKWNMRELAKMILVSSSNDGARAIAGAVGSIINDGQTELTVGNKQNEQIFVDQMNVFSAKIGLRESHFKNEHGLDLSKEEIGASGSARDVAVLFSYLLKNHPDILESTSVSETVLHSSEGLAHPLKNTNPALVLLPGLLASKTGFTDLAGGNVAVVVSPGLEGPFAMVVLGSSYEGRFSDLQKLSDTTLEYLEKNR